MIAFLGCNPLSCEDYQTRLTLTARVLITCGKAKAGFVSRLCGSSATLDINHLGRTSVALLKSRFVQRARTQESRHVVSAGWRAVFSPYSHFVVVALVTRVVTIYI